MATIIQRTLKGYEYLFQEISDPRTNDWWLMSNPGPLLTILASYLYFCSYAGPRYMKDKKPYNLKTVIMAYNLFQIAFSIFLTYNGIYYAIKTDYNFSCHSIDYSNEPQSIRWAADVWWYFVSKITELLDTVFFVLRKKNNQVSFLHLYHHTLMPTLSWIAVKYSPGGQAIPEGTINAFIHILMYGYYFLAGLGPQYQKYLWWKKYLTSLQLIQFCIVLYLNVTGIFAKNCNYPKYLNVAVIFNCFAFLYMFGMFYYRSYVKNAKKAIRKLE
ncbi:elongation of very long chain fatty acids protein 7-like [Manduca sexta]|uniref:elongation of very long chain fatty acids protein 7-like n=1 Tax=Manduca sexta TaxID=7130 RepID=UPI00188E01B7|nr:elongation of very long chain fatty acids protein 7-like [Manduca sexta]